jgi:predicted nucleic-acid-binding protein
MIGIDTNILVRFLTQDDESQYQCALHLFHNQEIFIGDTVWLASEWVLRYTYGFSFQQICVAFLKTIGLPNIQVSNTQVIAQAIDLGKRQEITYPPPLPFDRLRERSLGKLFPAGSLTCGGLRLRRCLALAE